MATVDLQFQAGLDRTLVVVLLAVTAAVLLVGGIWQLARRRWRQAALCLGAAAGPPGAVAVLGFSAARDLLGGRRRAGRMSLLADVAVGLSDRLSRPPRPYTTNPVRQR